MAFNKLLCNNELRLLSLVPSPMHISIASGNKLNIVIHGVLYTPKIRSASLGSKHRL